MSDAVVDASLSIKWVLSEQPFLSETVSLLNDWAQQQALVIVPSWFACEVANVLYQRVRAGTLTVDEAQANVLDIMAGATVLDFEPATALRALEIAHMLGEKASYDSQYLALAEHEGCELWTADEHFWNAARTDFPQVRWIGEHSTSHRQT